LRLDGPILVNLEEGMAVLEELLPELASYQVKQFVD